MESMQATDQAIKSVTLIVLAGPQPNLNDQVWSAVRGLGNAKCRAEVRLVDPNADRRPQLVTYQPAPKVYSTLAQSLDSTKYQRVVVLDHQAQLSMSQWLELLSTPEGSTKAVLQTSLAKSRKRRIWMWLYSMFVYCFLRTRKTEFVHGAIIFSATQSHHYMGRLSGDPQMDITGILALAVQHRRQPIENVSHSPTVLTGQTSARPVRAAWKRAIRFWFNCLLFPKHSVQVASPKPKKKVRRLATLGILAIAGWILFGNLGYPLFEPVETRNAQLALSLIENRESSASDLHDGYYWSQPPLQTWAIAASYKIFGASAWATRFPIALASMLTVLATFFLGRRMVGFRAAAFGSLFLLMSIGFAAVSRYTTVDATLIATTTATFLIGFESVRRGFSRSKSALAGVTAGLGVMVQGPMVVALCGPPLMIACWLGRGANPKADRVFDQLVWFALPMLLVVMPWLAYIGLCHPESLAQFFWRDNVMSLADGANRSLPLYYYLLGIVVFMFPVSYLLPSVCRFALANRADQVDARSREVGYLALAVLWIFAFFTVSSVKQPAYLLSAFPLLCLLMGCMVDQKLFAAVNQRRSFLQKLVFRAPWELPVWSVAVAVVSMIWFECSWTTAAMIVVVSLLGSAAMLTSSKQSILRRQQRRFGYGLACVGCVLVVTVTQQMLPAIAKQRSDLLATKMLDQEAGSNATVVFFGKDVHAVEMALGRKVVHFDEKETQAAADFLSQTPEALLVAMDLPLESLKEEIEQRVSIKKAKLGRHVYRAWALTPPVSRSAKQTVNESREQF